VLRLGLLVCLLLGVAAPAARAATTVGFNAATAANAADVTITGDATDEAITVVQVANGYLVTRADGALAPAVPPCTGGGAAGAVTCPFAPSLSADLAGGNDTLSTLGVTNRMQLAGGTGNDQLSAGAGADVLAGGAGDDTLVGGPGADSYFGEAGNDVIEARDGIPERIACGPGDDQARNDFTDILAECERGIDADGDGFSSAADCDDGNAGIHPGATDVPENRVDEDCDGRDAVNLDRDHDGFAVPVDCNDSNKKIHPGAVEVRGNNVDENCDRRAQPFGLLRSLVATNWEYGAFTRVKSLVVRNAPKGARIALSCRGRGCPFRGTKRARVARDLKPVGFQRFFRRARLRAGVRVRVAVTAAGLVGRTYTYRVEFGDLPAQTTICRAPGARQGKAC
jgi:putative metal-binding protein/hemolysin type calcium-binding protein